MCACVHILIVYVGGDFLFVCVCVCTRARDCLCVCMCEKWTCMHVCMNCMCACLYTCMHMCICICVRVCTSVCMCVFWCAFVCVDTYVHTCTPTHPPAESMTIFLKSASVTSDATICRPPCTPLAFNLSVLEDTARAGCIAPPAGMGAKPAAGFAITISMSNRMAPVRVFLGVCTCVCVHLYVSICVYVSMWVCAHTGSCACIHKRMPTLRQAPICVCERASLCDDLLNTIHD